MAENKHPQFGEINHGGFGCVERPPQFPLCNHDRSSTEGEVTETTASNRPAEVWAAVVGSGCSSTALAARRSKPSLPAFHQA